MALNFNSINWKSFAARFPIAVVVGAFAWSAFKVFTYHERQETPDVITIRIGHWQLEAGVRDAFAQLGADYAREVNPHVRIVQDAIPESTYAQWVSSQMMGETAPDIVEVGQGLPPSVWLGYENRYFLPLDRLANAPNPYNKGTDLEHVPLRNTFLDAMRGGYVPEMSEYFKFPLAAFSSRVFYNRDLLQKLTGLDTAPTNYQEFKRVCQKIANQHYEGNKPYIPIVGSQYHFTMWEANMADPLTYGLLGKSDFNRDGVVGSDEQYVAFKAGTERFDSPELVGRFKMVSEIAGFCQSGFTGLTRDEGVFMFAQQHAVFISSGTWDANSLFEQAKGSFRLGIMRFPFPTHDDPEFGPLVSGPVYDNPGNGFPLGVTRFSKHPDIAEDFLLYLSSRKNNAKLNAIIGWIPAIKGAPLPEHLASFKPQLCGQYNCMNIPAIGGDTQVRWLQLYSEFQINQLSYADFAAQFAPYYLTQGLLDLQEQQRDWRRNVGITERSMAGLRGTAMTATSAAATDENWIRYRTLLTGQQLQSDVKHARQMKMLDARPGTTPAPYEYSPQVLAAIRQHVAQQLAAKASTTQPSTEQSPAFN